MLGFVNLFKPPGPTSTQFGARLRWIYGRRGEPKIAIGHVGTLDPQACGVLPIALGRATRLIPLIADRRKGYAFTLVLGHATTTGDASGEPTVSLPVPEDALARLDTAIGEFLGRIEQIPPMYSALKVDGRRLYDLAREGRTVERKPRTITIYALSVLGADDDARTIRLRVACSEGTYVRTLAEDLARAIGTVGHVGALLREAAGPFVLSESLTLRRGRRRSGHRAGRTRTRHRNPDRRPRSARLGRLSRRPRRRDARARRRKARLRPRFDAHACRRRRDARHDARPAQGVRLRIRHALPPQGEGGRPVVLAIGFFDGFHRGHRAIVAGLMRKRRQGFQAAVLTFRNHPATHLRPNHVPPMISTLEERLDNLGQVGIDTAYLLTFDDAIARLDPQRFLDEIVIGKIGARALVVGENFRFGAGRAGDAAFARSYLEARGIEFVSVPQLDDENGRISSTRIRSAIAEGDVALADVLLGAPYAIRGRVVVGFGRGHDLGFPTANLTVPGGKLIPADGVYRCIARHDGRDYAGLLSIGTNPTFDGTERTVEVWLRDFVETIYGEEVALREIRFIREQRRFDSVDALLEQMHADVAAVPYPSIVR